MKAVFMAAGLFLLPAPAEAQAIPVTISGLPEIVAPSSSYPVTVSIPSQPGFTAVCVKATRSDITVSPANVSFAPGETTKQVTVTTATSAGVFGVGGSVGTTCSIINPQFSFVQARLQINALGTALLGQPRTFSITLASIPPSGLPQPVNVSIALSGDGATGTTLSTPMVTLPSGTSGVAQSFQIVAGLTQGDLVLTATPGGPGAAYIAGAVNQTVPVGGTVGFVGLTPGSIPAGGSSTFQIGLNVAGSAVPVTKAFTVTPQTSGIPVTVTPATVPFAVGDTTRTFAISAGPSMVGDMTLKFETDSPYATNGLTFTRRVIGSITRSAPSSLAPGETSGPITLTLSHPNPKTFTLRIQVLPSSVPGSTASVSTLTFDPGDISKSFAATAGAGTGSVTLAISTLNPSDTYFAAGSQFSIPVTTAAPTPVGTNVTVTPATPPGGQVPVTVTFGEVTTAGFTTIQNVASPLAPPSGYEVPGTPLYFVISSNAQVSGSVSACAGYANAQTSDPSELRLFRWVAPGPWLDVTQSLNTTAQEICGTGAAGPNALGTVQWGIFRPNTPPTVSAITGPDVLAANTAGPFTATVHDVDDDDVLTATWVWGDGTTSPATITNNGANGIATAEHSYATGGEKYVTLVLTDGANNVVSEVFIVTVDAAPPVINSLMATPGSLWPPDNKMHAIALTADATDDGGRVPVCRVTDVAIESHLVKQSEYLITGDMTVSVKAHPQTAYTVTVTCTDAVGRTSQKTVTVRVEKP